MYLSPNESRRLECLRLANQRAPESSDVVHLAREYEAFISGSGCESDWQEICQQQRAAIADLLNVVRGALGFLEDDGTSKKVMHAVLESALEKHEPLVDALDVA